MSVPCSSSTFGTMILVTLVVEVLQYLSILMQGWGGFVPPQLFAHGLRPDLAVFTTKNCLSFYLLLSAVPCNVTFLPFHELLYF
jgi:hypothetical protein